MDVVYFLEGIDFEWDPNKAQSNLIKHGITFEEAAEALLDPFSQFGEVSIEDEQRDFLLGFSVAQRLLLVVHLQRGERIRLISARLATRSERKLYENI